MLRKIKTQKMYLLYAYWLYTAFPLIDTFSRKLLFNILVNVVLLYGDSSKNMTIKIVLVLISGKITIDNR